MNSRNVCFGAHLPDQLRADPVGQADHLVPKDLSDQAREGAATTARQNAEGAREEELAFAREALSGAPGLSEGRARLLRERIQTGYYSRQDVVDQIAARLTTDLIRPLD